MNLLASSEKKKKQKKQSRDEMKLGESFIDTLEGQKKKKKKKKEVDELSFSDSFDFEIAGKKKKKSKHDGAIVSSFGLNGTPKPDESTKKRKKSNRPSLGPTEEKTMASPALEKIKEARKRKSSFNELLDNHEDLPDLSTTGSPKKKKKEKIKEETLAYILASPKKHKIKAEESFLPPKSAKKLKNELSGQNIAKSREMDPNDFTISEMGSPMPSNKNYKSSPGSAQKQQRKLNSSDAENTVVWSVEEEVALIDQLLKTNQDEKASYRSTLNKFNWDEVTVGNYSTQECQVMVENLIHKITKFKTLHTVLVEARDLVVNHPEKKTKKDSKVGPESPKDPSRCYYESQVRKGLTGDLKGLEFIQHCRKTFSEMSLKKKSKYIVESCKEWAKYAGACKSFKETHPDWNQPISKPPYSSLLEQYFDSLGVPKNIKSIQGYFMADMKDKGKWDKSKGNKLMAFNTMFRKLPDKEKDRYKEETKKYAESFETRFAAWKKSVDKDVALAADAIYMNKATTGKNKDKKSLRDFNTINVTMVKPKFAKLPVKPPSAAFMIFKKKFEERRKDKYATAKDLKEACSIAWKNLPEDMKVRYEERYKECRVTYKEHLLEFVRNMGNETTKVFLGFNRIDFYKFFKGDIFEEEFPNSKYPVYEVEMKEVGTLEHVIDGSNLDNVDLASIQGKTKPENSETEDEDSDSDDSEEEEETKMKVKEESDDEESDEESDDEESGDDVASPAAFQSQFRTPVRTPVRKLQKEEDSDSDDEDEVLEAWQTPKRLEKDSDDDEEDSDEDSSD